MQKDVETQRSLQTLNYDIFPIPVDVCENIVKIYTQYREKRTREKFMYSYFLVHRVITSNKTKKLGFILSQEYEIKKK